VSFVNFIQIIWQRIGFLCFRWKYGQAGFKISLDAEIKKLTLDIGNYLKTILKERLPQK
jgi:hypothetical protein